MSDRKTMTLNLPAHEMQILEDLAKRLGMTKTATVRRCIRGMATLDLRVREGYKITMRNHFGNKKELVLVAEEPNHD